MQQNDSLVNGQVPAAGTAQPVEARAICIRSRPAAAPGEISITAGEMIEVTHKVRESDTPPSLALPWPFCQRLTPLRVVLQDESYWWGQVAGSSSRRRDSHSAAPPLYLS